jgi:diguanylate cyclase (GGDEF)-like protein
MTDDTSALIATPDLRPSPGFTRGGYVASPGPPSPFRGTPPGVEPPLHDALTDLPNRVLFQRHLSDAVEAASGDRSRVLAVMLMDLDHFKEINDTLGHHVGDILLQQIGPRLSTALRKHDLMARLGGDEFGIVLPDLPSEAAAVRVAGRMMEELEKPFSVEGLQLDASGSIGIALYPAHSDDVETLLRGADVAMYAAKESGAGFEVYKRSLDRHSAARLTLIGQVRPAIDNHELVLWYQPMVRLSDERVVGAEALVRWMHPERGIVMPDQFIPMVERTVLLRPMTQYLIELALQQSHRWERMGLPLEVAVNLSTRSLLDQHLPEQVAEALSRWQVLPERLTLELTESFLMAESGRTTAVLTGLSEVGVMLSIDDFGTGYSSLSHLRRLPIDEIKIDRSFVTRMRQDPNDTMLVQATVDLGRNLGLRVVAEGVETRDAFEDLALMGCDMAQGSVLTKPLPATELTAWIAERGGPGVVVQPAASPAQRTRGAGKLRAV